LIAVKNRLEKEDRYNHAKLVKDSIESRHRLMASTQKQTSIEVKEIVIKKTFDATIELRTEFK